jgi:hypothetical protein
MLDSLLQPAILFFILGLLAGIFKSDLKLPEALYESLSIYLLLSIGLKGGVQLTKTEIGKVILPIIGTIIIGLVVPFIAYFILRKIGKFDPANAAAVAAHYGSVSAVTFAVVQEYLDRAAISYDNYVTVLVVVLEIPAIGVGILIARLKASSGKAEVGKLLHEVFLNKSIVLLVGGMLIGFIVGADRIKEVGAVLIDPFKGLLTLFLLEMGLITSRRIVDLRKIGFFLVGFGIIMPLFSAVLGIIVGILAGMSLGGTIVLATLAASASYIAAPAAMRIAVPQANPTLYLTASLGITFPFNIIIGISIYTALTQFAYSLFGLG